MFCAAAGFSVCSNSIPFVTTFAAFSLRAFEQIRLSICYAERNVKIVASHPGLDVGPDGASAQALEDIAAYRSLPGLTVISPADPIETALATRAIVEFEGPVYMRTGRSSCPTIFNSNHSFSIGKGQILRSGSDLSIIACGVQVSRALEAHDMLSSQGINARVINMPTIKPIDIDLLVRCASETGGFVTCEDHNIFGGLGSAVAEVLCSHHPAPIEFVGVCDSFGESGEPDQLRDRYGLSARHIADAAIRLISRNSHPNASR